MVLGVSSQPLASVLASCWMIYQLPCLSNLALGVEVRRTTWLEVNMSCPALSPCPSQAAARSVQLLLGTKCACIHFTLRHKSRDFNYL